MRHIALAVLLLWPAGVHAKVINAEFNFTPFIGDTAKDEVEMVAGSARVLINGIPFVEQEVEKRTVPVLFEAREVGAAIWITGSSLGSLLRKGKNVIRVEFTPADAKTAYRAQLRWALVNDETTATGDIGQGTITNQSGEGADTRDAKGKVVLEKEFVADFAEDQPWHHYPQVGSVSEEDMKLLAALVARRLELYQPDFTALYAFLKQVPAVDAGAIRSARCLDKAHAAGVRMAAADASTLRFSTTGGAAVVIEAGKDGLYAPTDRDAFEKIKDEEAAMCASVALYVTFPPRLIVVKSPKGSWEVVS
ncbi:MAG TPA: hypothetical protein VEL28_15035 [Candidatus Binatia bacterium]|nr:hypothetical protein [Candidatus Binatia bacterium]